MTDTFRHLGVCTGLFFCLLGSPEGAAAQTTALFLDSEPGDYVGQGLTQTLLPGVNQFSPSISSDRSTINLYVTSADVYWYLNFAMPGRLPFAPGVYENAIGWSSSSTPPPILEVRNLRGGGCSSSVGRFITAAISI